MPRDVRNSKSENMEKLIRENSNILKVKVHTWTEIVSGFIAFNLDVNAYILHTFAEQWMGHELAARPFQGHLNIRQSYLVSSGDLDIDNSSHNCYSRVDGLS